MADTSAEITRQLRILKKRLDEDASIAEAKRASDSEALRRDMKAMQVELRELNNRLSAMVKTQKTVADDLYQRTENKSNELARVDGIEARVYSKIVDDLNTKVLPKMTSLAEFIHYTNEDPMEAINKYRHSLDKRGKMPAIGSGNDGPRLFFK